MAEPALDGLIDALRRLPGVGLKSAQRMAFHLEQRQARAEEAIHSDPLVRELMNQFKSARIVPGSIKPV